MIEIMWLVTNPVVTLAMLKSPLTVTKPKDAG